jgi:hypothetical protein
LKYVCVRIEYLLLEAIGLETVRGTLKESTDTGVSGIYSTICASAVIANAVLVRTQTGKETGIAEPTFDF